MDRDSNGESVVFRGKSGCNDGSLLGLDGAIVFLLECVDVIAMGRCYCQHTNIPCNLYVHTARWWHDGGQFIYSAPNYFI